jgi:hypothetical protein
MSDDRIARDKLDPTRGAERECRVGEVPRMIGEHVAAG